MNFHATFDAGGLVMKVEENVDLFPFNTFGIHARARYFATVTTREEVQKLLEHDLFRSHQRLFLGGGSNILFTDDFNGLVVKNAVTGISVVSEDDTSITLNVGSGENWHAFVMHCVSRDYGGIENLSLIPGTVGAAPMQNIGAYGVEVKEVIDYVNAIELATGRERRFSREECAFGYRESIFKLTERDQFFISSVTLTLTKKTHRINTGYGAIADVLRAKGITNPSISDVSSAVVAIRTSKLPDPAHIGNAGSFFKNPVVTQHHFDTLSKTYPTIPSFPVGEGKVKVPAGWLIEQCGWKGFTRGNIGVHKNQALVLVNYGGGEGRMIRALAEEIQSSVQEKFGIHLQPEVNIIGS